MTVKRQAHKNVFQASWLFGHPVVRAANNSTARWAMPPNPTVAQKGGGWLVELVGGLQTGDDFAACDIPTNEYPVPLFQEAQWSYYMNATQTMGVNIVIWVHDPDDFDNRAEITQLGGHADLEKTSGWNAHEFTSATGGMFYYGEGTTGTNLTAGTQYTWAQFQADALFKDWLIYRISFEYGWEASGTFSAAYLAEVKLNQIPVPLIPPQQWSHRKTVQTSKTMLATAKTTDEVISESTSAGTDWDFAFGGTGYIVKAIITHDAAITPRLSLLLFNAPPAGQLNDEGANSNPLTADVPYYIGRIDFPAMSYNGTGDASTIATPSTYGNLPLAFDNNTIYGVLVQNDATSTFVAEALTISLTAEMDG